MRKSALSDGERVATVSQLIVVAAIVALHLALAALLLASRPVARQTGAVVAMTVTIVPLVRPPAPQIAPAPSPIAVDVPPPEIEIASSPASNAPCDLLASLGADLRADPAVPPALAAVAVRPTRTLMVWNGRWSDEAAIGPLRRAVVAAIAPARNDCLDEPLTGPRLIFLPINGVVVSIVVGSGTWQWRDLLSSGE